MVPTTLDLQMTSREIAVMAGKAHHHVLRDIASMMAALGRDPSACRRSYTDSMNREQIEYALSRADTLTLFMGYNVKARATLVALWQEQHETILKQSQELLALTQKQLGSSVRNVNMLEDRVMDLEGREATRESRYADSRIYSVVSLRERNGSLERSNKGLMADIALSNARITVLEAQVEILKGHGEQRPTSYNHRRRCGDPQVEVKFDRKGRRIA